MRFVVLGVFGLMPALLFAMSDFEREEIQERISPVGKVRVQTKTGEVNIPPSVKKEPLVEKKSPQTIYEQYCFVCHRDGIAGAPKFQVKEDWAPRLAKKNIDALTTNAINGLNAMPAKGTCQECSDADIRAVVEYMVPQ